MVSKKKLKSSKDPVEEIWLNKKKFVLLALGVFLSVFVYSFLSTDPTVRYEELKTVYGQDGSFSISLPEQMEQAQGSSDVLDYQDKNKKSEEYLSHIRVEPQYFGSEMLEKAKPEIIAQLKAKKGDYYDVFIKKVSNGPISNQLKFEDFSSENGESAYADFSYMSDQTTVSGRLLVTFSADTMYFVAAEATNEIWYENLTIWNKVINSFKAE